MRQADETKDPEVILANCQAAIGYSFENSKLLRSALTHTSIADHRIASNERLEFLGDAVLGLIVVEQLYLKFPEYSEGDLTKVKSAVVSRRTCAHLSKSLELGQFLFMGKGMSTHPIPNNTLADVFEALIGAIYLDGGLKAAKDFLVPHIMPEIDDVAEAAHAGNYKSLLQQVSQREYGETPGYHLLDEKGPDHSKCFKVSAVIGRYHYPGAWGRTKKDAEQKAAMNALAHINGETLPHPAD